MRLQTLADLVFAADIRNRTLTSEPFQDRRHLGLRIDLSAFHAHPLRHYTRLALCLSPKGSSIPRCQHDQAYFHRTRHLYACKACDYQTLVSLDPELCEVDTDGLLSLISQGGQM